MKCWVYRPLSPGCVSQWGASLQRPVIDAMEGKAALCRMHSHRQHHVSLTTQRAGSPAKVSQHYRTFQLENTSKSIGDLNVVLESP